MRFGEKESGFNEHANFRFPEEDNIEKKENKVEAAETIQEVKFEALEIRKTDIKGVEDQMERERNREGLNGGQRLAFEGAALERLRKEAPEAGIEKVELTDEDIEKCRQRMEKDIIEAIEAKTKKGEKEGWDKIKTKEEIKSEQVWIREFQTSYLKEILDEKKFKESGLEVSGEEWEGMVDDLRDLIAKKDWHKVIPRMGHMNNLEPKKFGDISRSLFDSGDKEGMLQHIEELKGNEAVGKKVNAWELASRIRYVAECFPELRNRISLDEKDRGNMAVRLGEAINKKWEDEKDKKDKGETGDYWAYSYQAANMKIIENMAKRGEIKTVENKIEARKSTVE